MLVLLLSIPIIPAGTLVAYGADVGWVRHVWLLDPSTRKSRRLSRFEATKGPWWKSRDVLEWVESSDGSLITMRVRAPFRSVSAVKRERHQPSVKTRYRWGRDDRTYLEPGDYKLPADGSSIWKGTRGYLVLGRDRKIGVFSRNEGILELSQREMLEEPGRPALLGRDGRGREWVGASVSLSASDAINLYWWLDDAGAHVVPSSLCAHVFDGRAGLLAGTSAQSWMASSFGNRLEVWDLETATRVVVLEGAVYDGVVIRPAG